MTDVRVRPYGSWKSPITSDLIVAGTIGLGDLLVYGEDIYWTENRPSENGRSVIVRRAPDGRMTDQTPPGFNARTRVHEYGGGAYIVEKGEVYFSNFTDQRLYHQPAESAPRPVTGGENLCYADSIVDRRRNRIIAVREDQTGPGRESVNTIVAIALDGGGVDVLAAGNDFYCSPRLSPDGSALAWMSWDHPNMPWDGAELWFAVLNEDGSLGQRERVAGGKSESIFQPEWSPDGLLYFVSDRSGWWNLYRMVETEI